MRLEEFYMVKFVQVHVYSFLALTNSKRQIILDVVMHSKEVVVCGVTKEDETQ